MSLGVTNHLLVAHSSEANAIASHDDPSLNWEGFYCQGLDCVKLIAIWSLIESGSADDSFEKRLDAITTISGLNTNAFVDVAPASMVTAFASLAAMEIEDIKDLASRMTELEDFEGWTEEDLIALLRSIGDHGENANIENKTLMIYTCL